MAALEDGPFYEYSKAEVKAMLRSSVAAAGRGATSSSVLGDLYSFAGSIVEQAKKVLDAAEQGGREYEGPPKAEMRAIVDGGIENLVDTLGDWGLYGWSPYQRVRVMRRPQIRLSSPRIDLNNIRVEVKATGELWAKFPWWNCYKWCLRWKKVIKCERIGSITVDPDIAAEAHANVEARGSEVVVRGEFDRLRLDYPILDKIPLEGIANRVLGNRFVFVIDASKLVVAVPVLGSKFSVESIGLPPLPQAIGVEVVVKQT